MRHRYETRPAMQHTFTYEATLPTGIPVATLTSEAIIWDRAAEIYSDLDDLIDEYVEIDGHIHLHLTGTLTVEDTPEDEAEDMFWEYLADDYNQLARHNTQITQRS